MPPRFTDRTANMATIEQEVIKDHTGHHRLAHGHSADTNARVMTAFGDDFYSVTMHIYTAPWDVQT